MQTHWLTHTAASCTPLVCSASCAARRLSRWCVALGYLVRIHSVKHGVGAGAIDAESRALSGNSLRHGGSRSCCRG
ncbi:hypothetical protein PF005_g20813 [Phytophthora fragariae]|uniref:Uncharacterized protein n=2 Tax=Phytophthora TaxID=4783 RepID=A0A6A3J7A3_9STRA|nr:hypothetical protein PF003_g10030 [Phytophthora fragariae]KAE9001663.1 hypothetical protein PR002_g17850 [Phytophthora rubi]KAE8928020.1 hypothetical protein PF009_g21825 [Phytophthora fragariae]KAE8987333.1 hypothetical protein PF011_g19619 [Phytophthora fragariae]KAE9004831.1 hypothetical protein PR001_g17611 [Phytophthora rubi]